MSSYILGVLKIICVKQCLITILMPTDQRNRNLRRNNIFQLNLFLLPTTLAASIICSFVKFNYSLYRKSIIYALVYLMASVRAGREGSYFNGILCNRHEQCARETERPKEVSKKYNSTRLCEEIPISKLTVVRCRKGKINEQT